MTRPAFTVINGGLPPTLASGGGSGGGGRRKIRRPRKHWLADALWHAVVTKPRPNSIDETHRRICRFMRLPLSSITAAQVNHVINVVRDNPQFYQWGIAHVGKGADPTHRRFFPLLVDYDAPGPDGEPYVVWDDEDYPFAMWGALSSTRTIASMLRHEADALEMLIPMVSSPTDRRRLRKLQAQMDATADMAADAAKKTRSMV